MTPNIGRFHKKSPRWILGFFLFFVLFKVQQGALIIHPSENRQNLNPTWLQHKVTFSQRHLFGDIYFLTSIQDLDFCRQYSDESKCKNKIWLFNMLDLATDLHSEFRGIFRVGALALSVLISDIENATKLLDKARLAHPTDKSLLMISAYHELYETKNKTKAAQIMIEAARNGAPQWYFTLAGRIYEEAGQQELSNEVLKEMKAGGVPDQFIERLKSKIDTSRK